MPIIESKGAGSAQGFGEFAQKTAANYIEDVFSTYLINLLAGTGNQQIPHGLNLSTYGGLTWVKNRASAYGHTLGSPSTGTNQMLFTNTTDALTSASSFVSFDTNGTTITRAGGYFGNSNEAVVSWNLRKQPKFFDVVTYTGNGSSSYNINHNLQSVPGFIIIKCTSNTSKWVCAASDNSGNYLALYLNLNIASDATSVKSNIATTTTFNPGYMNTYFDATNINGQTYVAYLFASDAGGFGLTGTDNVISCGSFTTDGSGGATVSLGYEPQWVMTKCSSTTSDWRMFDNMRGMSMTSDNLLRANTSGAESTGDDYINPTATGFVIPANGNYSASQTFIYIAIRRGPMKVPTDGTKVFKPLAVNNSSGTVNTTGFPIDMQMQSYRSGLSGNAQVIDRLRGISSTSSSGGVRFSGTSNTNAESSPAIGTNFDNTGFATGGSWAGSDMSYLNFRRAPSFFDEVCYTGVGGTSTTVSHNLGVTPELIIYKPRSTTGNWPVAASAVGFTKQSNLNLTDNFYANYDLTATSATVIATAGSNSNGTTYVAYLFATCPGVSKVGIYTGNGTTQAIACGFTGGARFVLIKRTDDVGDWYVYDTARGMTTLTDPYLLINSTAAESATLGSVTTTTGGFTVNASILSAINTNSASYLFLAIA